MCNPSNLCIRIAACKARKPLHVGKTFILAVQVRGGGVSCSGISLDLTSS